MKNFHFLILLCVLAFTAPTLRAQQQDVTRFLDIPVDGSKSDMIRQLLKKGFTKVPNVDDDVLTGEFNGQQVNVHINTNQGKVWRIMVLDVIGDDATNIKNRFNLLLSQFYSSSKYLPDPFQASITDLTISETENIEYEILVTNKQYEAAFYQIPAELENNESFKAEIYQILSQKYTDKQLSNPSKKVQKDMVRVTMEKLFQYCSNNVVWFKIVRTLGDYRLVMYYDNCLNQANGEDL